MKTNMARLSLVLLSCSLGVLLVFRLIGSHGESQEIPRDPSTNFRSAFYRLVQEPLSGVASIIWRCKAWRR